MCLQRLTVRFQKSQQCRQTSSSTHLFPHFSCRQVKTATEQRTTLLSLIYTYIPEVVMTERQRAA